METGLFLSSARASLGRLLHAWLVSMTKDNKKNKEDAKRATVAYFVKNPILFHECNELLFLAFYGIFFAARVSQKDIGKGCVTEKEWV